MLRKAGTASSAHRMIWEDISRNWRKRRYRRGVHRAGRVAPGNSALTLALSSRASEDYRAIIRWSVEQFGPAHGQAYATVINATLGDFLAGRGTIEGGARPDIAAGVFSIHVARHGRKGRHLVIFHLVARQDSQRIEVLRVLHDSMDLPRHF